jgi:hypothetical protein
MLRTLYFTCPNGVRRHFAWNPGLSFDSNAADFYTCLSSLGVEGNVADELVGELAAAMGQLAERNPITGEVRAYIES